MMCKISCKVQSDRRQNRLTVLIFGINVFTLWQFTVMHTYKPYTRAKNGECYQKLTIAAEKTFLHPHLACVERVAL